MTVGRLALIPTSSHLMTTYLPLVLDPRQDYVRDEKNIHIDASQGLVYSPEAETIRTLPNRLCQYTIVSQHSFTHRIHQIRRFIVAFITHFGT